MIHTIAARVAGPMLIRPEHVGHDRILAMFRHNIFIFDSCVAKRTGRSFVYSTRRYDYDRYSYGFSGALAERVFFLLKGLLFVILHDRDFHLVLSNEIRDVLQVI